MRVPASPFWSQTEPTFEQEDTHILDAAFVDDESLTIVAQSGSTLDKAIDIMLAHVWTVFEDAHLDINTAPGKTEALLKYRGKQSSALRERRRDTELIEQTPRHAIEERNRQEHDHQRQRRCQDGQPDLTRALNGRLNRIGTLLFHMSKDIL